MSRILPLLLDVVSTLFIRLAFFFFSSTRVLLSTAIYTHYYFASATDQNEKNCTRIARIRVSLENWRNERSFVACFAHPSILSCRNDKMMKLQTIQIVRFPFQFKKKKKKIIINISGKILLRRIWRQKLEETEEREKKLEKTHRNVAVWLRSLVFVPE